MPRITAIAWLLMLSLLASRSRGGESEPAVAIHDVLQLEIEGKHLVLRTQLPPTPDEELRLLNIAPLGPRAELVHLAADAPRPAGDSEAAVPRFFRLQASNDDTAGQRIGWQVSWQNDTLDIQRSVHFTGQLRYTRLVRLISSRSSDQEGDGHRSVHLMVSEAGNLGREPIRVHVGTSSFSDLITKYPQHTEEYLRPLLRGLGQEAVFAPEPHVAWQVFADRWVAPVKLKEEVATLLPALDGDSSSTREAASKRLNDLGGEAAMVLMQLDRSKLSAEQNSRIDIILAAHAPLPQGQVKRLRNDVSFLLDCLNCNELRIRTAALERLRTVCRRKIDFDLHLDTVARSAAVAALRERLCPPAAVSGP